jgi:ParB family chromosome partitioning protein
MPGRPKQGQRALGRGIEALLKPSETTEASAAILLVPISALQPGSGQPRQAFAEESLEELARSIEQQGILQPILVEKQAEGSYSIIAGERRFRAARLAGLTEVPVILKQLSEEEKLELALIENLQREDLKPLEEALAYRKLMTAFDLSQEEVARRVGRKRPTVANSLRLLNLPQPMQEALNQGRLTPGHARAILSLPGRQQQEELFARIVTRDISVREAERAAAKLRAPEEGVPAPQKAAKPRKTPLLETLEQRFIERLGTKVSIKGSEERGRIEIDYFSGEDLERIWALFDDQAVSL